MNSPQQDKALKTALTAVAVLAVLMFAYYWLQWRTRKTENDVNLQEKVEAPKEDKSAEFAGVYSANEPIEGLDRRFAFISLNRKEDGSGYFGSAKVDQIASANDDATFFQCNDVSIGEKDFFVKCTDAQLGQISFVGEWNKASGSIQVPGKILWSRDGNEIANKSITLTHTGG